MSPRSGSYRVELAARARKQLKRALFRSSLVFGICFEHARVLSCDTRISTVLSVGRLRPQRTHFDAIPAATIPGACLRNPATLNKTAALRRRDHPLITRPRLQRDNMRIRLIERRRQPLCQRRPTDSPTPPARIENGNADLPPTAASRCLFETRDHTNRLTVNLDDATVLAFETGRFLPVELIPAGACGCLKIGAIPALPFRIRGAVHPSPQEIKIGGHHRPERQIHHIRMPRPTQAAQTSTGSTSAGGKPRGLHL